MADEEGHESCVQCRTLLSERQRGKAFFNQYPMVAEDDVDMESLQAQIDMSMSFAQNLVTSWIKPTHLTQLRPNGVNAAQILEEESRRPPRLGVGASIPTAPPLAHEASKLKRRLGKNRTKNGDVVQSQPQDSSKSDDEEHKGRPAKRKTKVDPFRHEGSKKKRKANSEANRFPSAENPTLGEPPKHNSSSGKEKERMGPGDQRSATLISSPPLRSPVQTTYSFSPTATIISSLLKPSQETYVPVSGKTTTSESSRVHTNSMPLPEKFNPLGIPLLNLDGPPELTDQPGNTSHLNNSRRKRRRRKKKKTQTIASTGDNSH